MSFKLIKITFTGLVSAQRVPLIIPALISDNTKIAGPPNS
jgi:hypothetical protein